MAGVPRVIRWPALVFLHAATGSAQLYQRGRQVGLRMGQLLTREVPLIIGSKQPPGRWRLLQGR